MAREQGIIVSFSRGYGFVTTGADVVDTEAPRYFFHASQVLGNVSALRQGIPVTFEVAPSDRSEGKSLAVNIRDINNGPIVFTRAPNVSTNVSAPGRRVAIAERPTKDDATFCFAIDQEEGERVFVPMPLMRGQVIEYTREDSEKGPKAIEITGPMGSPLQRPNMNGGRGMGGGRGFGRGMGMQQQGGNFGGRGGFYGNNNGMMPHNGNMYQQQQQGAMMNNGFNNNMRFNNNGPRAPRQFDGNVVGAPMQ